VPIESTSSRPPAALATGSALSPPGTADTRPAREGLAQAPRLPGAEAQTPRPRVVLGTLLPQSPRAVPAAVDQALQAVLPEVFTGPPSAQVLAPLREGLGALHDALRVAGEPGDLRPLVAALSDRVRLHDFIAVGAKGPREGAPRDPGRDGLELDDFAARGAQGTHEEAVGVLAALVDAAREALGPGRDGAALAALYGHSPALDRGVRALRTQAATRFMLADEARRQGLGDASALPAALRQSVRQDAQAFAAGEYEIARTKLQIVRTLGAGDGFVPALMGLRFTPALARGMRNDNAESGSRIGVLVEVLLSQERELAQSPAGQRLRAAVPSPLQPAPPGASARDHRADLQRTAALQPLPAATSLSGRDQSALGMTGLSHAEGEALMQWLAHAGLAGVSEVEGVLAVLARTQARVAQDHDRIAAADHKYQKSVGTDQGQALAAGLLRHLTGDAQLPAGPGARRDARVRAALTGPAGPLAALGASAEPQAPLRQRLLALGERHAELAQSVRMAQAGRVIDSFAAFDSLAAFHAPAEARAREAAQQPRLALIEQGRQGMQAVVAERRALLGPRGAGALQDAVRAAVLATHPDRLDFTPSDGLAGKVRKAFDRVGPAVQTGLLAQDPARLHADAVHKTLAAWGLPAGVVGPEVHQVLAQPIDAARIRQWAAEFQPVGDVKAQWQAAQAGLADRQKPAGAPGLEAAALQRFIDGVDSLQVGTRLSWTLGSTVGVSTVVTPAVAAERRTQDGIHVERDAKGYQLTLSGGTGGTGSVGLQLGVSIPQLISAQATAGIEGTGHRLGGVALRFADSDTGRADMQALLQRLLAPGPVAARDLGGATEVMPLVERMAGGTASAGARLGLDVPVRSLSVAGQADSVSLRPRLHAGVAAGGQGVGRTRANQRQQVQEQVQSFHVQISVTPDARLPLGIVPTKLPDPPTQVPIPVYGTKKDLVDLNYQVVSRDVREDGLVSGDTERVARIKCPAVLADAALDHVGGPALQGLIGRLRQSDREQDQAVLQDLAALRHGARAGAQIGVVWRLDPQVRTAANGLLQKARTAANRQGGHAHPKEVSAQFEAQAKALLDDPGSYVLHGLELVASEKTWADLGKFSDLSGLNLGVLKWNKSMEGTHERRTASLVFDPAQVRPPGA
jgi:hypothetical protein